MPAAYFPSHKALRSSAKFLLRCSQSSLFQSYSYSALAGSLRAFQNIDRFTTQSVVRALSRIIFVPSLTGQSYRSCIDSTAYLSTAYLVSVSAHSSSSHISQRSTTSVGNALSHEPELIANNQSGWGSTVDRKPFWFRDSLNALSCKPPSVNGSSQLASLLFSSCPNGVATDIPLDGSPREELLDSPSSSSEADQKKPSNRVLKLLSGSCYLPHPDKEETGGEDAHFIWDEQAIGVADGVGGWADQGVDSGQYSRSLMLHSVDAIEEEPKGSINPLKVLEKAYARTKEKGSSTACIIALTDQGIHAVNLGDSGFIIVRDGCTVFKSPVQQHDFNFTYQLESSNASDLPSSAQVFTVPVESGDVIVTGTDGLFDNLYNNEITAVVVHGIRAGLEPQVMAQKIAALARQRAQDKNRQTPFSTAAQHAGYRYYGGKLDDITVLVSFITAFGA
ncbi:hypothetical protein ZIOFF_029611 [Zingiber officinale]|uniref:Protein phosphatase n=1 Tax=Zingiber officinale TaxID=94328 RepID=A0A8J5LG73_ZINOF|nr:hypothetical protein ZIOFF_029611 [Zingiber officinale]